MASSHLQWPLCTTHTKPYAAGSTAQGTNCMQAVASALRVRLLI